jgi:hypothetical protein
LAGAGIGRDRVERQRRAHVGLHLVLLLSLSRVNRRSHLRGLTVAMLETVRHHLEVG